MNGADWMVFDKLVQAVDNHNQGYVSITRQSGRWVVKLSPVTDFISSNFSVAATEAYVFLTEPRR